MSLTLNLDTSSSLADLITSIGSQISTVQGNMTSICLPLLGVTVAIKIVMAWVESGGPKGTSDFYYEALYTIIMGLFMQVLINNAATLTSYVWTAASGLVGLMNASGASGDGIESVSSIFQNIWDSCLSALQAIFGLLFDAAGTGEKGTTTCEGSMTAVLACKVTNGVAALAGDFFAAGVIILSLVAVLLYTAIMMLQVFGGLWSIVVAVLFFQLCCAFYPVNDAWFKNCLGKIASGVAQLATIGFLMGIIAQTTTAIITKFSNGDYAIVKIQGSDTGLVGTVFANTLNTVMGKALTVDAILVLMIVMALSASKALGVANQIFGSVGGFMGVKLGAGSSGGGSSGGGSKKEGLQGRDPISGGAGAAAGRSGTGAALAGGGAGGAGASLGAAAAAVPTGGAGAPVGAAVGGGGAMAAGAAATSAGVGAGAAASAGAGAAATASGGVSAATAASLASGGGGVAGKAALMGAAARIGGAKAGKAAMKGAGASLKAARDIAGPAAKMTGKFARFYNNNMH